jgi:hypothetical protein
MHISSALGRSPHFAARVQPTDAWTALLYHAGDLSGAYVLVVSEQPMELVCSLLSLGCLAVTGLRSGLSGEYATADLALGLPAPNHIPQAVRQMRHGLAPAGRLLMALDPSTPVSDVRALLRAEGFCRPRLTSTAVALLAEAERPWFGASAATMVRSVV